jgi:nicotinamide-nucleotide amidase
VKVAPELGATAALVLDAFRTAGLRIATAESCTGGLIAALLTSLPGSSDVFDRGFVTYSNESKSEILGIPARLVSEDGAVSASVASAMANGALAASEGDAAVAVTGIAGPGGGSAEKPVGLVFIAVALRGEEGTYVEEFRFEDLGRDHVRNETAKMALEMLLSYSIDADDA